MMSHVAKLSLAVVLALAAAGLNAMWLSAQKRPPNFVAAAADVPAGREITDDMLMSVPVPGDLEKLRAAIIPYDQRAILYGLKTPRAYTRGDMFFQRDIQAPLEPQQFEILGPFRLISVGERFKQADAEAPESQLSAAGDNVTIAVSAKFDERTRRLLEIIDPNRQPSDEGPVKKIVAVQVIPKDQEPAAEMLDDKDVVYQTVSLQGIENVPRVLLAGDVIRFVIPASDEF
jgi:hypothetical protein